MSNDLSNLWEGVIPSLDEALASDHGDGILVTIQKKWPEFGNLLIARFGGHALDATKIAEPQLLVQ